jgi:hypothetical protein
MSADSSGSTLKDMSADSSGSTLKDMSAESDSADIARRMEEAKAKGNYVDLVSDSDFAGMTSSDSGPPRLHTGLTSSDSSKPPTPRPPKSKKRPAGLTSSSDSKPPTPRPPKSKKRPAGLTSSSDSKPPTPKRPRKTVKKINSYESPKEESRTNSPFGAAPPGDSKYADELYEQGYTVVPVKWFVDNVRRLRDGLEGEFMRFPEFIHHPRFDDAVTVTTSKDANLIAHANKVFDPGDDEDAERLESFLQELKEHKQNKTMKKGNNGLTVPLNRYGLGGTSFLGAPSVFHNPVSRQIRMSALIHLVPMVFSPYVHKYLRDQRHKYRLEVVPDRVMVRPKGDEAAAESWHRDVAPATVDGDIVFGGWLNLDLPHGTDDGSQTFSCVPSTHRFAKDDVTGMGFAKLSKAELEAHAGKETKVKIPPGHVLIFAENLVHEVVKKKRPDYTTVRQFLGWALTKRKEKSILVDIDGRRLTRENIETLCRDNAVIPLKSGQYPPMYPEMYHLHRNNRVPLLQFVAYNLVPNALRFSFNKQASKKKDPVKYGRPINLDYRRSFKSLREMGVPLHPEYTVPELRMLMPQSHWDITDPDTGRVVQFGL